jgi:hypothetical protein
VRCLETGKVGIASGIYVYDAPTAGEVSTRMHVTGRYFTVKMRTGAKALIQESHSVRCAPASLSKYVPKNAAKSDKRSVIGSQTLQRLTKAFERKQVYFCFQMSTKGFQMEMGSSVDDQKRFVL